MATFFLFMYQSIQTFHLVLRSVGMLVSRITSLCLYVLLAKDLPFQLASANQTATWNCTPGATENIGDIGHVNFLGSSAI